MAAISLFWDTNMAAVTSCENTLYYLKWFRHLRCDPVHQEVMNTLRRFMDEESMDYEEAAEAAVDKRKFLLNRLFEKPQVPDEEEEEEEEEDSN